MTSDPRLLPAVAPAPRPWPSAGDVVATLRRRWRILALAAIAAAGVTVTVLLLLPRSWTSNASFTLSGRRTPAQFSGLAAQLGVNLPQSDASQTPAFYVDLLRSRTVLEPIVADTLPAAVASSSGRSLDLLLEVDAPDAPLRRERTIRAVNERLVVTLNAKSGLLSMSFRGPSPAVSQWVLRRLLEEVSRFTLEGRRSQATAERRFTERRLAESRDRLRTLEDALVSFRLRNRDGAGVAPDIALARTRLEREVGTQQQIVATLTQAFEQARLEEVRDTPVISVVEAPNIAAAPDRKFLLSRAVLAALLVAGGVAAILVIGPVLRPAKGQPVRDADPAGSRVARSA